MRECHSYNSLACAVSESIGSEEGNTRVRSSLCSQGRRETNGEKGECLQVRLYVLTPMLVAAVVCLVSWRKNLIPCALNSKLVKSCSLMSLECSIVREGCCDTFSEAIATTKREEGELLLSMMTRILLAVTLSARRSFLTRRRKASTSYASLLVEWG